MLDDKHKAGVNVVNAQEKSFSVAVGDELFEFSLLELKDKALIYINAGVKTKLNFAFSNDDSVFIETHEGCVEVENKTHAPAISAESAGNGQIKASMDGGIMDVLVEVGATVAKGQTLVVLEAMKMEHAMKADTNGIIKSVLISKGDQVKGRQLLVEIESDEIESEAIPA